MPNKKLKRRILHYYRDGVECHLCNLPIPGWVVSTVHPLSGTIDHIIPKSQNGHNGASNRAPAHRCCNHFRGIRTIDDQLKQECVELATSHFAGLGGIPRGPKWKRVRRFLRRRARLNPPAA